MIKALLDLPSSISFSDKKSDASLIFAPVVGNFICLFFSLEAFRVISPQVLIICHYFLDIGLSYFNLLIIHLVLSLIYLHLSLFWMFLFLFLCSFPLRSFYDFSLRNSDLKMFDILSWFSYLYSIFFVCDFFKWRYTFNFIFPSLVSLTAFLWYKWPKYKYLCHYIFFLNWISTIIILSFIIFRI